MRSQHGRRKLFASAKLLWEAAAEYFTRNDNNPSHRNEVIKSGEKVGKMIKVPVSRPYTLSGLCLYLGASETFWRELRKREKQSEGFLSVITRIEEIIRTQKFEGAAAGAFNANIIARDLGLRDKMDIDNNVLLNNQSDEKLDEIIKHLIDADHASRQNQTEKN
ncbi:terminase small subunit [Agriterribacter sp.]|uniref:terminase small subunit n=1 Tax=Agriterribacter sp. TaxID=2821509 RepID=UPI002BF62BE3|nr:terminase small subunit [Agriterribacter sp.]HRP54566.1 terminase small subunit [Agriterribacter sp.]